MARFLASLISCILLKSNYRRNRRMAQRQGFGGALGCRTASELLGDYKTLASLTLVTPPLMVTLRNEPRHGDNSIIEVLHW